MGRLLSNFAHTPFVHEEFGNFESMEGFYYFVSTGGNHDELKKLWGFKAKEIGSKYEKDRCSGFEELMRQGCWRKVLNNQRIKLLLSTSVLDFKHYYVYGSKIVEPHSHQYWCDIYRDIRAELQADAVMAELDRLHHQPPEGDNEGWIT